MNFDLQIKFLPCPQLLPTLIFRLFLFSFPPSETSNYTPNVPFFSLLSILLPYYFAYFSNLFHPNLFIFLLARFLKIYYTRCETMFHRSTKKAKFFHRKFFFVRDFKLIFTTTRRKREKERVISGRFWFNFRPDGCETRKLFVWTGARSVSWNKQRVSGSVSASKSYVRRRGNKKKVVAASA